MKTLNVLCSVLQNVSIMLIIALFVIKPLPTFIPILVGIGGFAGIVKLYLPTENDNQKVNRVLGAFIGFVVIIFVCVIT